jgi:serine/threonine protein kinase
MKYQILTKIFYGMVPYIDPQRFKNKHYKASKKSDVYSVGIVLWELSSGQEPFNSADNSYYPVVLISEILDGRRETPILGTPIDYVNIYTSMILIIITVLIWYYNKY